MQKEGYWDYMSRRRREENLKCSKENIPTETLLRLGQYDMAEMQKQVHLLQLRIIELHNEILSLQQKIVVSDGDERQLELSL